MPIENLAGTSLPNPPGHSFNILLYIKFMFFSTFSFQKTVWTRIDGIIGLQDFEFGLCPGTYKKKMPTDYTDLKDYRDFNCERT
jgi:hypothetical protein